MNNTYQLKDPGGAVLETTAPNLRKAVSNFRFRLVRDYGMTWFEAAEWADPCDVRRVK